MGKEHSYWGYRFRFGPTRPKSTMSLPPSTARFYWYRDDGADIVCCRCFTIGSFCFADLSLDRESRQIDRPKTEKMAMWVFGYGSLTWKAGFDYDDRVVGFIKGYRRVFYQGSTDHRGTPEYPGRTVTLEPVDGEICWGVAYKISKKEDQEVALTHLEVREKQYDEKAYLDFFTDPPATTPAVSGIMVYIGSPNKKLNQNYLGPAPLEEIAKQIIHAEGPSGPNRDYLFQLESALLQIGCKDKHVIDLANEVRRILSETWPTDS